MIVVVVTILAGALGAVARWLVSAGFAHFDRRRSRTLNERRSPSLSKGPGEMQHGRALREPQRPPVAFPWAVLIVNVAGSALAGVVLGLAERAAIGDDLRFVLLTGVCGGLTTFSTWSVETVQLIQQRRVGTAVLSVAANLALGVGACVIAYLLAR